MSGIIGGLAKYVGIWLTAGTIGTVISLLFIFVTGGLIGVTADMITSAVVGALPFPISIMVGYAIDPVSFVAELILQTVLFFGLLYLAN